MKFKGWNWENPQKAKKTQITIPHIRSKKREKSTICVKTTILSVFFFLYFLYAKSGTKDVFQKRSIDISF